MPVEIVSVCERRRRAPVRDQGVPGEKPGQPVAGLP